MVKDFKDIYEKQFEFQKLLFKKKLNKDLDRPVDDLESFSYHIKAMVEEMGELLASDKRWKTHRNSNFDIENKKEELADVFITAFNLAIHSGFDASEMYEIIDKKIKRNIERLG